MQICSSFNHDTVALFFKTSSIILFDRWRWIWDNAFWSFLYCRSLIKRHPNRVVQEQFVSWLVIEKTLCLNPIAEDRTSMSSCGRNQSFAGTMLTYQCLSGSLVHFVCTRRKGGQFVGWHLEATSSPQVWCWTTFFFAIFSQLCCGRVCVSFCR